eukprot:m.81504 g.81504  ORF g.81504 m.81504 type:complete len:128 (-) comp50736_c0_seq11:1087-1470(-)
MAAGREEADLNSTVEGILQKASALQAQIATIRAYETEVKDLNGLSQRRSAADLIDDSTSETINLRWQADLQHENDELRIVLERHQAALDLIMHRHRTQVSGVAIKKEPPRAFRIDLSNPRTGPAASS